MPEEKEVETTETEKKVDVEPEVEKPEEKTTEPLKEDIDYEAELAKERERGKPDPDKAKEAFEKRKIKKEEPADDEEVEDDEDRPLTKKEAREFLRRESDGYKKQLLASRISEIAEALSQSEAEKNLIIEIHKNRTFPDNLSLEEQLEESYVIANRKKILSKTGELVRKLKSKETSSKAATGGAQDAPEGSAPKLTSAEAMALRDAGMVWDGVKRAFKKQLGGGKFYYFDPKTRKRWSA